MSLKDSIIGYLESQSVEMADVEDTTPLFTSGLLDSILMVELIGHLESTLGKKIPATDVNLDNLDTIEAMLRYCERVQ